MRSTEIDAAQHFHAFTASVVLAVAFAAVGTGAETIDNGALRLSIDGQHGTLQQIEDLEADRGFLKPGGSLELWSIELNDGSRLLPSNARSIAVERRDDQVAALVLTWSDFSGAGNGELRVCAQITLDEREPVSRWRIRVSGLDKPTRTVTFPRIGPIAERDGEAFAMPRWIGESTRSARRQLNANPNGGRWAWDYPGEMSMQFVTFYSNDGGLLFSTNDTRHARKQFSLFGEGNNGLGLEVVHFAAIDAHAPREYELGYEVVLRLFDGDWYTAAEHYRNWARDQWWVKESRVRRGLVPQWVGDTGVWVWNRGRSPGVTTPATALQKHAQMPVSIFWHWWHGCAYDVGFPEYLPPREGKEPFREAVTEAESHGIHSIVYMNQRLWGMTTKSWSDRNAAAHAVKRADGKIQPEVYNTFVKAACASMCIATPFWRNTYAELAESAVRDLGVAGIYMDQACTSLACYDPSHGHPLGGGTYWMEGFKKLQADIRERTGDVTTVALAGEGCGEAWLPYLDIMLSLQVSLERYYAAGEWEPVPLFNAVYHDSAIQYGNYSSLTRPPYDDLWPAEYAPKEPLALLDRKFATQFRLEQARSFVWGQQPTLANFREEQLTKRREEVEFLLRLARLRLAANKYLRDGVFLRPPEFESQRAEIPMSRLSIYAGQLGAVQESTKTVPLVLASAWRAPDGDIGIALANISEEQQPIHIVLDRDRYPLPEDCILYRRTPGGRTRVASFREQPVELKVTLDGSDAQFYEIVDAENGD